VVFGGTPGAISSTFLCECALWSHTYIPGFIQICSDLGELQQKTPSATLQSECSIGYLSLQ